VGEVKLDRDDLKKNNRKEMQNMNAKERAIETFKRLGLMPYHLVNGNLAGDSRKELRRAIVWGITGSKPTLAQSRLGIVEDLMVKTFEVPDGTYHDREERLLEVVRQCGLS
jgi:hypothetical protein